MARLICGFWLCTTLLLSGCANGQSMPASATITSTPGITTQARVACFGQDASGAEQIYSFAADGSDRRQLTHVGANSYPTWTPDGKQILYAATVAGQLPRIWMMAADGSQQHEVSTTAPAGVTPFMAPDGQHIAFSGIQTAVGHAEIWVMDADGGNPQRLTNTPVALAGQQMTWSVHPTWSPDSKHLVYASTASGDTQIWMMQADGSQQKQMTHGNGTNYPDSNVPDWSADGTQIVFWSGFETKYGDVWVMQADGSNAHRITQTQAPANSDNPHWSANGAQVLFDSNRSGNEVDVFAVPAAGGTPQLFARGMEWCTWQP